MPAAGRACGWMRCRADRPAPAGRGRGLRPWGGRGSRGCRRGGVASRGASTTKGSSPAAARGRSRPRRRPASRRRQRRSSCRPANTSGRRTSRQRAGRPLRRSRGRSCCPWPAPALAAPRIRHLPRMARRMTTRMRSSCRRETSPASRRCKVRRTCNTIRALSALAGSHRSRRSPSSGSARRWRRRSASRRATTRARGRPRRDSSGRSRQRPSRRFDSRRRCDRWPTRSWPRRRTTWARCRTPGRSSAERLRSRLRSSRRSRGSRPGRK